MSTYSISKVRKVRERSVWRFRISTDDHTVLTGEAESKEQAERLRAMAKTAFLHPRKWARMEFYKEGFFAEAPGG